MIDANIDPFNVLMWKYITGFSKGPDSCENVIVKTLYNWLGFKPQNCLMYGAEMHTV